MVTDEGIFSHNDSGHSPYIYLLDSTNFKIAHLCTLINATNIDWEEITRDDKYAYIGDFGNNQGSRKNLRIYKVKLSDLNKDKAESEIIDFKYPDQTVFDPASQNNDFDMEAMISMGDSLYLFSKNWVSLDTRCYSLPKNPGSYEAHLRYRFDVDGLITGAAFDNNRNVIVLVGYNPLLQPFTWVLWDFKGTDFFSGNKRKIQFRLPFHQVEAILYDKTKDSYLISNERFSNSFINIPAQLHQFDINTYIENPSSSLDEWAVNSIKIYPNPTFDILYIEGHDNDTWLGLYNSSGALEKKLFLNSLNTSINISNLSPGIYFIRMLNSPESAHSFKIVVKR